MIRINLLGTPKPKNKRSRVAIAAPSIELGEVGSPAMKILVAIVLAGGLNAAYWYQLDHQAVAIAAKSVPTPQKPSAPSSATSASRGQSKPTP